MSQSLQADANKKHEHISNSSKSDVDKSHASKSDVTKTAKLSSTIKKTRKQLAPLIKQLIKLHRCRMDCGYVSRSYGKEKKKHKRIDPGLYQDLKNAIQEYNATHMEVSSLKAFLKRMNSELYYLNKKIHGQETPQETTSTDSTVKGINENTICQRTNPGAVITIGRM